MTLFFPVNFLLLLQRHNLKSISYIQYYTYKFGVNFKYAAYFVMSCGSPCLPPLSTKIRNCESSKNLKSNFISGGGIMNALKFCFIHIKQLGTKWELTYMLRMLKRQ